MSLFKPIGYVLHLIRMGTNPSCAHELNTFTAHSHPIHRAAGRLGRRPHQSSHTPPFRRLSASQTGAGRAQEHFRAAPLRPGAFRIRQLSTLGFEADGRTDGLGRLGGVSDERRALGDFGTAVFCAGLRGRDGRSCFLTSYCYHRRLPWASVASAIVVRMRSYFPVAGSSLASWRASRLLYE